MKNIFIAILIAFLSVEAAAERIKLAPLLDITLADASVACSPDGIYYLTGTSPAHDSNPPDFNNNDGVWLWKSSDLRSWVPLGQVWSISKDAPKSSRSAWQMEKRIIAAYSGAPKGIGMTAPEIHFIHNTCYITYSMNQQGTGLLRSKTGKPEGPYEDLGRITATGGDASMSQDDDGTVYWVWGSGNIARMKPDLTGLAGTPIALHARILGHSGITSEKNPEINDPRGGFLFKRDGRYYFVFTARSNRTGIASLDTFVSIMDRPEGPASAPVMMVPRGGQATVFKDDQGAYWSTYSGGDEKAVFSGQPGIVPLVWGSLNATYEHASNTPLEIDHLAAPLWGGRDRPICDSRYITERGPWDRLVSVTGNIKVTDPFGMYAPELDMYYATGDVRSGDSFDIFIWRSRDLEHWEKIGPLWTQKDLLADPKWPVDEEKRKTYRSGKPRATPLFGCKICRAKGTYWMLFFALNIDGKDGTGLLRSISGKPEGPYESYGRIWGCNVNELFADDDGSIYFLSGSYTIFRMKDDMSGVDIKSLIKNDRADGAQLAWDAGSCLAKVDGRYLLSSCAWNGSYDRLYHITDDLRKPWRGGGVMGHCGGANIFKGRGGQWYSIMFKREDCWTFIPNEGNIHIFPIHMEWRGDNLFMEPEYMREKK